MPRVDEDDGRVVGSPEFRRYHHIPDGFLSLGEVAAHTGMDRKDLARLLRAHRIVPTTENRRGWKLFPLHVLEQIRKTAIPKALQRRQERMARASGIAQDAVQVEGIAPLTTSDRVVVPKRLDATSYTKEQGLRGFELLREGKAPADLVSALDVHPAVAAAIVEDFARLSRMILIPRPMLEKLDRLPLDGSFPLESADDVWNLCASAVAELKCRKCHGRSRTYCKSCALAIGKAEVKRQRAAEKIETERAAAMLAELEASSG